MKKILIIGLIAFSLLITSMYSVVAAEEEKTFEDPSDDVVDMLLEEDVYTDQKPNIDIINIIYSKNGKDVTLSLEVKGEIEDRGDLDSDSAVVYNLILNTDKEYYDIAYINNKCYLNEAETGISFDKDSTDDSIITFSFELVSADETYAVLAAQTTDYKITSLYDIEWFYADDFEDISEDVVVDAGSQYEGVVNESINFSGNASGGSPPYTWEWNFGDGNTSDEQNPTHVYSEAGEYYAVLTVTDSTGIWNDDYATVVISAGGDADGDDGSDGGADGTSDNGGTSSSSSDAGLLIFGGVIAIIAILGVIVIIAIIRR